MKKNKNSSIDGFVPRQAGNQLGGLHRDDNPQVSTEVPEYKPLHTTGSDAVRNLGEPQTGHGLGRSDIDDSLRDIDDDTKEPVKKLSRRQRRRMAKQLKRPRSLTNRIIRWFILILVVAVLAVGGYFAYKFINAGGNVFQGNILAIFENQPLKQDSNGRSNFLILGTSEDDPGHPGSTLTDSMLVVSVDQNQKNVYMFSVPRDLYVQYGAACTAGYAGKINEYFSCSNSGTTKNDEQDRLAKTQKFVGNIFGLDIQYGVHVDQTVIKQAVDAVGGIDVNIEGDGYPGILDRNFDWRCNYTCYLVKYDNGIHHLDGAHALYLSMARGDVAPTYGLANSNFDREKNQQKIIIALRDKAISTGTITNLDKITKLIDALGNNLRTNIQTSEIRTLMQVAGEVKSGGIRMLSLLDAIDSSKSVVTTGMYGGASVVMPSAGIFDYSGIQAFVKKNLSSDPVVREAAPVVVLNGSGQAGYAQTKADSLTSQGFTVSSVGNAPAGKYGTVVIYQIGTGNTGTAEKLSTLYGVTIKKTAPPVTVDASVKFVIIFGTAK